MTIQQNKESPQDLRIQPWTPQQARAWRSALLASFVLLGAAGFLLARLIWLPFYFGLFFFLVAGLLAGAISYRLARPARPLSQRRILWGVCLVGAASALLTVVWEYEHIAATIGDHPKFPEARNAAVKAGRPAAEITTLATARFQAALAAAYPPGGPIGYVRWAVGSGALDLEVQGCKDSVSISHHGLAWVLRTLTGFALLAAGLWASFESLRSPVPVSNILAPGEECQEDA